MKEIAEAILAIKDVGLSLVLIVGIFYVIIFCYPKWMDKSDAGKKERAEIYANALKYLGDAVKTNSELVESSMERIEGKLDKLTGDGK